MSVLATRQTETPSEAVIEAVADREGVDPMDLAVPLYDAIDPDALDALVQEDPQATASSLRIEFTYYGYTVAVSADGPVEVVDTG